MIDFIVCDDNNVIRGEVEDIINAVMMKNELAYKINMFEDYNKKFFSLMESTMDSKIYILDIEVPSKSGIDIARLIRKKDRQSTIIFLTTHDELGYALLTSRLNFLTFVSKLDDYKINLSAAIEESLKYIGVTRTLDFMDHGVNFNIPVNNILYIYKDTFDRKSVIKTGSNEYSVYTSLTELEKSLPESFKKSHRACIVNLDRVESIDYANRVIKFDNGKTTDLISRTYKKELV